MMLVPLEGREDAANSERRGDVDIANGKGEWLREERWNE